MWGNYVHQKPVKIIIFRRLSDEMTDVQNKVEMVNTSSVRKKGVTFPAKTTALDYFIGNFANENHKNT